MQFPVPVILCIEEIDKYNFKFIFRHHVYSLTAYFEIWAIVP